MQTRSRRILVAAALLVVAAVLFLRQGHDDGAAPGGPAAVGPAAGDDGLAGDAGEGRRAPRRSGADPLTTEEEAIRYLQEQFGAKISNKWVQVKALEKLVGWLRQAYPEDWQERLRGILARAFPGMEDELLAKFQSMTAYNDWLEANRLALHEMDRQARRDALRDARFRFFGADADEIFAEALRQDRIFDATDEIARQGGTTMDQKLDTYLGAIEEGYGEATADFLERRRTELLQNFLQIPTVQDDLHSLPADARGRQMDEIRREMGLDEEARERWRRLDAERDAAWEAGDRYMQERARIVESFDGAEEARRLSALRNELFGPEEAEILRGEEEAGFFRFDHRRVFGTE